MRPKPNRENHPNLTVGTALRGQSARSFHCFSFGVPRVVLLTSENVLLKFSPHELWLYKQFKSQLRQLHFTY